MEQLPDGQAAVRRMYLATKVRRWRQRGGLKEIEVDVKLRGRVSFVRSTESQSVAAAAGCQRGISQTALFEVLKVTPTLLNKGME